VSRVQSVSLSRVSLALLAVALVLGGVVVGRAAAPRDDPRPSTSAPEVATPHASPAAVLPLADVAGQDIARLPRYPGSVRSGYQVFDEGQYRLTAAEYLAAATVDDVRAFYQGVIATQGWERADIGFSHGEWAYVLVDGSIEALIEIEEFGGLVEIDLQLSEPLTDPTQTPAPVPTTPPQPAAPPPPPPPPDDDDDDDDATDDDATDDDAMDG
jgi:hypothetical protein